MKYLQYGLTGFFVLLGAIWYVPAMIWGYEASQYTQASVNGDLTPEQDGAALERVMEGPAPLAWWRTRSDLRAHFRLDAFTAERTVHFERRIPIGDLLAPGEDRPHPSLYQAYAAARAPAFYAPNCAELLDTIATSCKIYHSESRSFTSNPETVEISSSMAYVPSYPLGDPTTVENGKMRTVYISVDKDTDLLDGDSRRAVYLRARDICAQVRSILGNCVIESVRFDDRFLRMTERSAGARNQDASISFAIFVDRTVYDRNDLDPIVENIAEVLAAETG